MNRGDSDTDKAPSASKRQGAFFGRRKGKRLRTGQSGLVEQLLPELALDLSKPAPADLRQVFGFPIRELRLEIGFGGGEHLIANAVREPEIGFIGIEAFLNGMAKALAAIERHSLPNIRLHLGDAIDVMAWLPTASIDRVDLLYPDPWPKRRHWKRRFVQHKSVAALARMLRHGGEFRFATDIPDYAAWTLRHLLASSDFAWTAESAVDWQTPWPDFERTRYEAKAVKAGRRPCYLAFVRR